MPHRFTGFSHSAKSHQNPTDIQDNASPQLTHEPCVSSNPVPSTTPVRLFKKDYIKINIGCDFQNRRWMNHMDGLLSHTLFIKSQMHTSHSYKTQPVIFSVLLLLNQNFCSGCDVHFSAAHQQKPFLQFQVYFSQGRLCISRGIKCNSLHVRSSHAKLGSRPALSAPAESLLVLEWVMFQRCILLR